MSTATDPHFGKLLLEQKPNRGNIGNAIFLMVLGLPMTLIVLAPAAPLDVKIGFFLFGSALTVFPLVMLWRNWMHVYLYETGIREFRQRRERVLSYDEAEEIIYSSLRLFAHGSYIHTIQKLAFKTSMLAGPPLVCTHIFKEADGRAPAEQRTPLVDVREACSRSLMERLALRLRREGTVAWTPQISVCSSGLQLTRRDGTDELFEWNRITSDFHNQQLRLFIDRDQQPQATIATTVPNFYAFAMLVDRLRRIGK